jgi:hypothetical protein
MEIHSATVWDRVSPNLGAHPSFHARRRAEVS